MEIQLYEPPFSCRTQTCNLPFLAQTGAFCSIYGRTLLFVIQMAEEVPGVTVHCDKELMAFGQMEDMQMKWHFKIQSEVGFGHYSVCMLLNMCQW